MSFFKDFNFFCFCNNFSALFNSFDFTKSNKLKHNIGLFAEEETENFDAVLDPNDIAPVFRRDELGTDIFVLGFEKEMDADWMVRCAICVIELFF